jgi:hypothetical protein
MGAVPRLAIGDTSCQPGARRCQNRLRSYCRELSIASSVLGVWLMDAVKQEHSMNKTIRIFAMASLLMTGAATAMAAGSEGGGVSSKGVTGTELGSPQTNTPATGTALGATSNQTAPTYPGTVSPTGSTQPDATNPSRSSVAGGGKN